MTKKCFVQVFILVLLPVLVACSDIRQAPSAFDVDQDPDYTLTLTITEADNQADILAEYGGSVVLWQPKDGFAVIGFKDHSQSQLNAMKRQPKGLEPNKGRFWAGGRVAWMNGSVSAWAGGSVSAWAGGSVSAWAGGSVSAWAGGEYVPLPQNTKKWNRMNLEEAQTMARHLGEGIKVAVIDSGIDLNHPALKGGLVPASQMRDYVDGDNWPQEQGQLGLGAYGHGTNVASIVLQMAPKAKILPLRVLRPDGSGDVVHVAEAILYAMRQDAKIINLSLGTDAPSAAVSAAIKAATDQGVFVVASSGNSGDMQITYPARELNQEYTQLGRFGISVGSVNEDDDKSAFSSYGPALELVALGEKVFGPVPGKRLGAWTGTSMAAPMVSGALALALAEPLVIPSSELSHKLESRSVNIYRQDKNLSYEDLLGEGRLDLADFIAEVMGLD